MKNMKKNFQTSSINLILLLLFILLNSRCHDIFEDNIERKKVILVTPQEGFHTSNPKLTLTWELLDGASKYNLKIVAPVFAPDNIQKIVLDTIVTINSFTVLLEKGNYQWGIKAMNNVSSTELVYRNLAIDSISVPVVILLSPGDKKAFNDTVLNFSWNGINNAQYIFSLDFNGQLLYNTILSDKSITLPLKDASKFVFEDGNYTWQVQARNASGAVSSPETRTFLIDRIAPGKPVLLAPKNDSLFSVSPVNLSWKRQTDSGSELYDSIFIASDSLFKNPIEADIVNATNFDFTPEAKGPYFWRVKTSDKAGNSSAFSNWLKFRSNGK